VPRWIARGTSGRHRTNSSCRTGQAGTPQTAWAIACHRWTSGAGKGGTHRARRRKEIKGTAETSAAQEGRQIRLAANGRDGSPNLCAGRLARPCFHPRENRPGRSDNI
jgi:hypothetical protein